MLPAVRNLVLRESTEIIAPSETVRAVFDDLESWPEWNDVCLDATWVSGEPWAIGSGFHMTLRMARRPVGFRVFVTEYSPHAMAWESTVLSITGTRRFIFEEGAGGSTTRVTDQKTFRSPYLPVCIFYPRPVIQAMSRGWLASLKRQTDKRQTELAHLERD